MTNTIRKTAKKSLMRTLLWFFACILLSVPVFLIVTPMTTSPVTITGTFSIATMFSVPMLLFLFLIKMVIFFIRPKGVLYVSIAAKILYFVAISVLSFFIFSFVPQDMFQTYRFDSYSRLCQYQANLVVPIDYEYSSYSYLHDKEQTFTVSSYNLVWERDEIIRLSKDSTETVRHYDLRILPKKEQSSAARYMFNQQIYWCFRILPILLLVTYAILQLFRSLALIKILRRKE